MSNIFHRSVSTSITGHILICCTLLTLLVGGIYFYMGGIAGNIGVTVIGSIFFIISLYVGRWLCVKWYLSHQYLRFTIAALVSCLTMLFVWWMLVKYLFIHGASLLELSINSAPFFILGQAAGLIVKFTRVTMQQQVKEAQQAAEQRTSELHLLQSQLSPHFLFNTLNNLYSLSISRYDRLPELLLKLSELLRYSVYDTKQHFVLLSEEIAYINNYLAFENMRISDRLDLKLCIDTSIDASVRIAPMILIVFVENAFKHARNSWSEKIHIELSLQLNEGYIIFTVKNSHAPALRSAEQTHTGIGMSNTMKRLELLYNNEFSLSKVEDECWYEVVLQLKIK